MTQMQEIFNFINNLNFIKEYREDFVLIDKNSPRIYKIPGKIFLKAKKDCRKIDDILINDYSNLKRWSYLPDPKKQSPYRRSPSPKLCLRVAEDCTLGCEYCFNRTNMLNAKKVKYMSREVGERAVRLFFSHFKQESADVIFFGGEPLMNFSLIKYLTSYIKKNIKDRKVTFHTLTNGTIMNEDILQWFLDNDLPVKITIDFPASEHNRNRPFKDGSPSFETIKNNILMIAKRVPPEKISLRGVIPKDSPCSYEAIHKSFCESGMPTNNYFADNQFISHPGEKGYVRAHAVKAMLEKRPILKKHRQELIRTGKYSGIYKQDICDMYLEVIMEGKAPLHECDVARSNAISVNPIGEIYFCDVKVNIKEFLLGDIFTGLDKEKVKRIMKKYCFESKECSSCWAQGFCSKVCPLTRVDKEGREQACLITKQTFMDSLDFFLTLNCSQIDKIIKLSAVSNKKNGHGSHKTALEIYKFLNDANQYIKPVNVAPY